MKELLRPFNSRLIGDQLFKEIAGGLLKQKYYALIGPSKMGKSLILEKVRNILGEKEKRGNLRITTIHSHEIMEGSPKELQRIIASALSVNSNHVSDHDGRLSEKILVLIELRLSKNPGKIIFMVNDILGLPPHLARELLAAFKECNENDKYANHVTAVVTGSADFISMVQSPTSPYRFAKQLSIEGLDKQFARSFFTGKLIADDIEEEAFDYLYEQTNGSMILLQEIASTQARKFFYEGKRPVNLNLRTKEEIKKGIDNYRKIYMSQSLTLRIMLRDIESRPIIFDKFLQILYPENRKIVKLQAEIDPEFFGIHTMSGRTVVPLLPTIPFLVGCGTVVRDDENRAFVSSPLLRKYLKKRCSWQLIADVYCAQYRWEKAWEAFSKCKWDEKYRPITGEGRFRLNKILVDWENSMHEQSLKGVQPLVEHFLNGVQHLLVFDEYGVWNISSDKPQPICKNATTKEVDYNKIENYKSTMRYRGVSNLYICLSDDQLEVIAFIPEQSPAIPRILVTIRRSHLDREIDTSCYRVIEKRIKSFCTALVNSLNLEYAKKLRKIREAHLKTLDKLHLAMAKIPLNLNDVLDEVCESLIEEGYYRVLICLVDSSRTRIQGTNEKCRDCKLILMKNTNYLLIESDKNIQPWVVKNKKSYTLHDALNDQLANNDLAKRAKVRGAGIVPMMVEDEVVGTLHFEREDKQPPGKEEMELFDKFANQLAATVKQGQRLAMLRDALHAIDNPIILHDVIGNVLFLNQLASEITKKNPGWQTDTSKVDEYFQPYPEKDNRHVQKHFFKRLQQVVKSVKMLRQYWAPYNKYGISATAWSGSPLKDDRGEIIGTVERFQDISSMFDLLKTIDKSRREDDPRERGRIYLEHLQKLGYSRARLYIVENIIPGRKILKSFSAVGFSDQERHEKFEKGEVSIPLDTAHEMSWLCVKEKMPLIIKHDPDLELNEIEEVTNEMGLPLRLVGDIFAKEQLEKKSGDMWIDIPLFIGKRFLGKMSLAPPADFTPERWQYLILFAQSSALAIDSAIRVQKDREEIEHNVIVARMLSHRLNASIGRCLNICDAMGKGIIPKTEQEFHAVLLANRFLGMQILIDYLLSGGSEVEKQKFDVINVLELLTEAKRSIEFEITDWKEVGIEGLSGWTCDVSVGGTPEEIKVKGSKHLLLRAIENIAINAVEAMVRSRKSGEITMNYQLESKNIVIDISSNSPPIKEKSHFDFIKGIFKSSGSLDELTQLEAPVLTENGKGKKHHRLGLKISTWIVKGIHNGSIDLLSDQHKSPHFKIKLPEIL
ncbi:MAG: GAF domain-containing protein [Candidatus Aminicenantes bacterium]|jgi:GAF domain-containing protein